MHSCSNTAKKQEQLLGVIKQFWLESGGVYRYRKVPCDLKDVGESCGINRVYRLMIANGLFCIIKEHLDYERQAMSQDHRLDSAWFCEGVGLKQGGLEQALQIVS